MDRRRIRDSDEGETLVELIIAITILGIAVVAIGSGILTSVLISSQHRRMTTASYFLHNYAETLQPKYTPCSAGVVPDYGNLLVNSFGAAVPQNFANPMSAVKFWNPTTSAFDLTSCPATDPGLQQVTLSLTTNSGVSATESLVVVVRSNS